MRKLDYTKLTDLIVKDIKDYFEQAGFGKAVIGLSGGIDSAVVAHLAVLALGYDRVTGLIMPSIQSNKLSEEDAQLIASYLGIETITLPLKELQEGFKILLRGHNLYNNFDDDVRIGNAAARFRMILLFDYASAYKCLVLGTENKSEHYLGYFTLFGDSASCIEPIRHLFKTEVFELAKYLQIPEKIINKKPSADLWSGQTDEGELGFTYKDVDEFIHAYENGLPMILTPAYEKIYKHINKVDFKHHIPYIIPDHTKECIIG